MNRVTLVVGIDVSKQWLDVATTQSTRIERFEHSPQGIGGVLELAREVGAERITIEASGKPSKVAITACMRKLLTTLNAMLRDQTPWMEVNA